MTPNFFLHVLKGNGLKNVSTKYEQNRLGFENSLKLLRTSLTSLTAAAEQDWAFHNTDLEDNVGRQDKEAHGVLHC